MDRIRRRVERSGFFLFFFAFLLLAIGLAQGVEPLRNIGLGLLIVILAVVIGRSALDVTRPKRRPAAANPPQSAARTSHRPPAHDPDNY